MKVSQKLENACRVMIQLARQRDPARVVRVEDLASEEKFSQAFLLQILNDLRRDGLVTSRRGKHGGYMLARPSEQITLADVVRAVEGRVLEVDQHGKSPAGRRVAAAWEKVAQRFEELLAETRLSELAAEEGGPMFYI